MEDHPTPNEASKRSVHMAHIPTPLSCVDSECWDGFGELGGTAGLDAGRSSRPGSNFASRARKVAAEEH